MHPYKTHSSHLGVYVQSCKEAQDMNKHSKGSSQ